ncbi:phosphatidylserine decarboxylase [Cloacibacillus evryensis]|uniref:phosphatidylserine decarboxylase n=1 Tax=Cloacibacillus evryensis TaxID=508460 RepID=UPI00241FAF32|nr:phosphatidylserine decarboxylase [Cloacibacillus evryensis]
MKLARDGYPTIAALIFMTAGGGLISPWISACLFVPLCIVVWFFRDPERVPERALADGDFLSPADGKVVEIEESEHEYVGRAVKIGIFMNAFSVHVNRFPTDGTVKYIKYVSGKKWFAFAPKASEINERLYVGAESDHGRFLLVQIAGILARRIVRRVRMDDIVPIGGRYGMIKMGSKVDIYLPPEIMPNVKIGDKVFAGHSIIGVLKK